VESKAVVRLCAGACGGNVRRMSASRAATGGRGPGRSEASRCGAGGGARTGTSGALLSELFGGIEGEQVMRILFAVRIFTEWDGFPTGEAST